MTLSIILIVIFIVLAFIFSGSILTGIFAAKVANCMIDLGIDINKLDQGLIEILYEVEREKRKELSAHEAAAYFFGAAFPDIPESCYLLQIHRRDMALRSMALMDKWVSAGKMRFEWAVVIQKGLLTQIEQA